MHFQTTVTARLTDANQGQIPERLKGPTQRAQPQDAETTDGERVWATVSF